jgi:hypothetical protein
MRSVLSMAPLASIRSNSLLRELYQRLLQSEKSKKVAITACMRKLMTILEHYATPPNSLATHQHFLTKNTVTPRASDRLMRRRESAEIESAVLTRTVGQGCNRRRKRVPCTTRQTQTRVNVFENCYTFSISIISVYKRSTPKCISAYRSSRRD